MRKIVVAVGVVLGAIALAAPSLVFSEEPQKFDAPTYKVGDTWTYHRDDDVTYTMTVSEISNDGVTMQVSPPEAFSGRTHFDVDRDGNVQGRGWRWLSFPLFVGKKWTFEAQGQNSVFFARVVVSKLTTIKTKAGTFEALLVEGCLDTTRSPLMCGFRLWYAPAIKWIVKREAPREWRSATDRYSELVSYTLAGQ